MLPPLNAFRLLSVASVWQTFIAHILYVITHCSFIILFSRQATMSSGTLYRILTCTSWRSLWPLPSRFRWLLNLRRGDNVLILWTWHDEWAIKNKYKKLEKKYAPAIDNYGQSCFVRSDFLKMKCVCKTQMMPPTWP
jgi:hypothetical protein